MSRSVGLRSKVSDLTVAIELLAAKSKRLKTAYPLGQRGSRP
jgi:hypothetical protein